MNRHDVDAMKVEVKMDGLGLIYSTNCTFLWKIMRAKER